MQPRDPRPPTLIIAGGGTGGHLFPGIAVAQEVQRRNPQMRVLFVGTARGIEVRAVPKYGFELQLLPVQPLRGRGFFGLLRGLWAVPHACLRAWSLLRQRRVVLALGVGGYAAGPALLMAALAQVPTAIMEQNAYAGLTNRLLARVCRRVLLAMPNRQLGGSSKAQVLGNPVRQDVIAVGERGRSYPESFATKRPLRVLVMGGSQGAHALNQAIMQLLPLIVDQPVHIMHQTGVKDAPEVQARYQEHAQTTTHPKAVAMPFIDDMAAAYANVDVAICRSGASTLAELAIVGLPSILVPYPAAADDHQTHNARVMVAAGGAMLLPQKTLSGHALWDLLRPWLENPELLGHMAQQARACAKPRAVRAICEILEAEVQRV